MTAARPLPGMPEVLPAPAVTVRVGPPDTVTTVRHLLADPVAVAEFLRRVLRARGG